jgi:hypothetical protein
VLALRSLAHLGRLIAIEYSLLRNDTPRSHAGLRSGYVAFNAINLILVVKSPFTIAREWVAKNRTMTPMDKRRRRSSWGAHQLKELAAPVASYNQQQIFKVNQQICRLFAQMSIGNLNLILCGPGRRVPGRCPTAITKSPVDGTAWCFK